ncbi:MAG: nucleotide exchange factor GrpE [Candidatus Andersenbacteria bacterium]
MIHARQAHTIGSPREQEYLEGWQRSRAELLNFRKSLRENQAIQMLQLQRRTLEPLLAIADNFQAVTSHVPSHLQDDAWVQGVLHVARQLEQTLHSFGLQIIETQGQSFDPQLHEAIAQVKKEGVPSNQVIEVVQQGYKLANQVLRPAKVKVSL